MPIRVIVPDSHGCFIDLPAKQAFLSDLKRLSPHEIVLLGDHVDVSGIFSVHLPHYLDDLVYSYEEDLRAANDFLDGIAQAAPKATIHYLEGNHEQHYERWISRTYRNSKDAEVAKSVGAPRVRLALKSRGIRYYGMSEFYNGLSIRGTIKLGKCHFVHGITASKHSTASHVARFGAPVVHGHSHRAQSYVTRTVASEAIGGWCPGTLAQLQPLYQHTGVTEWSHGYGLQFVNASGRFLHLNVPIIKGLSMLDGLQGKIK